MDMAATVVRANMVYLPVPELPGPSNRPEHLGSGAKCLSSYCPDSPQHISSEGESIVASH